MTCHNSRPGPAVERVDGAVVERAEAQPRGRSGVVEAMRSKAGLILGRLLTRAARAWHSEPSIKSAGFGSPPTRSRGRVGRDRRCDPDAALTRGKDGGIARP